MFILTSTINFEDLYVSNCFSWFALYMSALQNRFLEFQTNNDQRVETEI